MYAFTVILLGFVHSYCPADGKTVSGAFQSHIAMENSGQYITRFLYNGENGLMAYRLENVPLAVHKEARLLLFQGIRGFDNLSCQDRVTRAQLTSRTNLTVHDVETGNALPLKQQPYRLCPAKLKKVQEKLEYMIQIGVVQASHSEWSSPVVLLTKADVTLSTEEHNQTIPRQTRPQAWHVIYADRFTCQEEELDGALEDVGFRLTMLNPDSAGNPTDHFSAEEAGLHSFFFLLILAYFVASCIYMQPLWQALYKGGPMHTVLKVLSTTLFLQSLSVLLNYIHMAKYARDGVGTPLTGNLAEFCDMVAQVQMLYMLLSLCMGWTVCRSRKSLSKPLQWDSSPMTTALALIGVVTQGALQIWEQFEDSEHHSYHGHHSVPGLLLMVLRVSLTLVLASVLYQIISAERSTLKRDFYLSFAKGCFLWFLCHPVLVLVSILFNEHQKEKVITIGVILCQSISVVILYRLFLSRSLYWEVSSLSSVTLPLTMSSSLRGRY